MAWIKSDESLSQHPKVDELAEILELHPAQAIGHLHYLWWWALSYADDGDITKYYKRIAKAANYEGDNEKFIEALVSAGWLDQIGETIQIHDWAEYHGALLDRRQNDRERKRKERVERESTAIEISQTTDNRHQDIFSALVEVCVGKPYAECKNELTSRTRGKLNVAVKEFNSMRTTPDEIRRRGFNYFIRWKDRPTPDALVSNWTWLDEVISPKDKKQIDKQIISAQSNKELEEWASSDE